MIQSEQIQPVDGYVVEPDGLYKNAFPKATAAILNYNPLPEGTVLTWKLDKGLRHTEQVGGLRGVSVSLSVANMRRAIENPERISAYITIPSKANT